MLRVHRKVLRKLALKIVLSIRFQTLPSSVRKIIILLFQFFYAARCQRVPELGQSFSQVAWHGTYCLLKVETELRLLQLLLTTHSTAADEKSDLLVLTLDAPVTQFDAAATAAEHWRFNPTLCF